MQIVNNIEIACSKCGTPMPTETSYGYEPDSHRYIFRVLPCRKCALDKTDIIDVMKAIGKAEDTIWFNDGTTVFEQLWGMYLDSGGDESALAKEFPENA